MAKSDSKYGDGVDQRDVPFYSKGKDSISGQITEKDSINEGAWRLFDQNQK